MVLWTAMEIPLYLGRLNRQDCGRLLNYTKSIFFNSLLSSALRYLGELVEGLSGDAL